MDLPAELLEKAAECYWIFAFDEGSDEAVRNARLMFNELCRTAFEITSKTALTQGFHRPTAGEFREALINYCRTLLRKKGKL